MFGFLERLLEWYERAAAGTLDAPGEPLHPPVAYPSHEAGCLVVHADAPRASGSPWLGAAVLRQPGPGRVDVVGWLGLGDAWPTDVPSVRGLADQLHFIAKGSPPDNLARSSTTHLGMSTLKRLGCRAGTPKLPGSTLTTTGLARGCPRRPGNWRVAMARSMGETGLREPC
jgi:hypothetical protein